jgi:hypothetical protein
MLTYNAVQHRVGYLDGFGSKIEMEFPELRKPNWGRRFGAVDISQRHPAR